jgi:hypothetical protein
LNFRYAGVEGGNFGAKVIMYITYLDNFGRNLTFSSQKVAKKGLSKPHLRPQGPPPCPGNWFNSATTGFLDLIILRCTRMVPVFIFFGLKLSTACLPGRMRSEGRVVAVQHLPGAGGTAPTAGLSQFQVFSCQVSAPVSRGALALRIYDMYIQRQAVIL